MNKKAMYKLTYGLFLLTVKKDGKDYGCIINTCQQAASQPNRLSIAVINKNHTCEMLKGADSFNVSVLTIEAPFSLYQRFGMQSGRDTDKFAGFDSLARSENGLLYLTEYANAFLSGTIVESHDIGSHTIFIADVTDGEVLSDAPSASYAFYQDEVKPKPAAPASSKKAWVCSVCGYVYEGEEVPDDFICPICNHGKEDFVLAAAAAVAPTSTISPTAVSTAKWVCSICGYVYEGEDIPADYLCPVCKAPSDKFSKQSGVMTWVAEHIVRTGKAFGTDIPAEVQAEILAGLRANFEGECTEVGMYLAMARVAHREGYPEIGKYWEKAGLEEAEHAAKFAELLGEVITDSTEKNLQMRVDAENGATAGKTELAKLAKKYNLDAIHDTVHEMARDEARHGKAFKGLLERYFK